MRSPARCLTVLLALVALAGAQVFGLQRGYLCECTGQVIETASTHCDVSPGGTPAPCDSHSHHERDGGTQQHTPVKVDLTAHAQGKDASAASFAAFALAVAPLLALPDFLSPLSAPGDHAVPSHAPPGDAPVTASAAVRVARCMVLLV